MALRAKPPEATDKRLKLFMFGEAKVGKTTAALQFPNNYVIDAERGTEESQYVDSMKRNGSEVYRTTDIDEVIQEARELATSAHNFRTITVDPITPLYVDLLEKMERKVGTEWGRHYGAANTVMKRLTNLLMNLDMNVIVTAHAKAEYGDEMKRTGTTFDGWKKLDYLFDLIIMLERRGQKRVAIVKGTRIAAFKDGEVFDWSYDEFQRRYGGALGKASTTVEYATADQIAEITKLLEIVKLPEGTVDKWLTAAGVDRFDDMLTTQIAGCIGSLKKKIDQTTGDKK